jgi:uncharacterized SAM-binding protein YcdF (DUF218 family)
MFFVLAKVLGFFAEPSNVLITLGLAGAVLMATRFARAGRQIATASLVLLAIFGLSPLANVLILPLEERFPRWDTSRGAPDGIVILGGSFDTVVSGARGEVALTDAAERLTVVADLARRYPAARIVFSGGFGQLLFQGANEGDLARRLLESFGVPAQRIVLENRSRDTTENARFSKALASPQPGERWLLITSAYHMPRAIGVFRQEGFPVEAFPVDWRTRGWADVARPFPTLGEGLRRGDVAMREWVGLLMYRLSGRTSALFPAP